ncbi:S8 family serine peptidase [Salininema proteolyticum]|uniref:S8 family serine peptidase n=1 Tax=Salininema proteolyticum TaxID=1607685 RepID=A0ABV8TWD4_9ACTN
MGAVPTVFHRYATTRRAKLLGATAAASALTAGLIATPAFAEEPDPFGTDLTAAVDDNVAGDEEQLDSGRYIVQMETPSIIEQLTEEDPSLTRTGIDFESDEASKVQSAIDSERDGVASDYGLAQDAEYSATFNGFASYIDADEAVALSKDDRVKGLYKDEMLKVDTDASAEFLGLEGENGNAWSDRFGDPESAGEGVIIGIIDTGFWPENPSLQPLPEPRPDQDVIDAKWNGECEEGEDPDAANNVTCNNKVIGARYFDTLGEADNGFASPREEVNHGTHVMTTAAGNYETEVEMDGEPFTTVSGMAPAARTAAYKVCWRESDSCASSNSVAAIEQAVLDGVDVINFSISGSRSSVITPVALAYFNAAASGVFVSNSAGNSGPTPSTVAHNYPWTTTVAASTQERTFAGSLTFGGQTVEAGAFTSSQTWEAVSAKDALAEGADPATGRHCTSGTLDPSKVEGKAVLCDRGIAFAEMAEEVTSAGGTGFVVLNQPDSSTDLLAQVYEVPMVHVLHEDGLALEEFVRGTDGAEISVETGTGKQTAPQVADFSSAGPSNVPDGNLLTPDITAPGVQILAGYPEWANGNDYGLMQGTSMSSPHIAGLGALLKGAEEDWTPMEIKSAMMTTAYTTNNAGDPITRQGEDEPATPFDYGAGHVDPTEMFEPGLTYDSDAVDWIKYMCSIGQGQFVEGIAELCDSDDPTWASIDPWDLNSPSVKIDGLAGSVEVDRTVTNVSDKMGVYFPEIDAPEGIDISIDKRVLIVKPGETADYKLTIKSNGAENGEYAFGSLKLRDNRGHEVSSPIAVQPITAAVAAEVHLEGAEGSVELEGRSSFDGTMETEVVGLTKADEHAATLQDADGSSFDTANPAEGPHTKAFAIDTTGSELTRFATFNDQVPEGTDLDVFVYQVFDDGSAALVGSSAAGGSDEIVTLSGGGYYVVFVDFYGGPVDPVDATLNAWAVQGDEGNAGLEPSSFPVTSGGDFSNEYTWNVGEGRWFGALNYTDGKGGVSTTLVNVRN